MVVLLIRHMESTFNVDRRVQGQTNESKLTPCGRLFAKKLSLNLKEKYPLIDGIFSSDLTRARESATEIASAYSRFPYLDHRLREISRGFFEGRSYDSPLWKIYKKFERSGIDLGNFLPGVESLSDAIDRFACATNPLIASEKILIVVSHGEIMRLFWERLSGFSLIQSMRTPHFHIENGCVLEIDSTFNVRKVLLCPEN